MSASVRIHPLALALILACWMLAIGALLGLVVLEFDTPPRTTPTRTGP